MGPPESNVLARLVRWAEAYPLVRALVLTSSRARGSDVDALSDYDMIVAVEGAANFRGDPTWLSEAYGPILVRLDPEPGRHYEAGRFNRLVIYADGTKIDWNVWPVEALRSALDGERLPDTLDVGYSVLLDKDHIFEGVRAPTHTAHIPSRPSEAEYLALVEEFWWETSYVAKNLWRDELFQARYSLDAVIKFDLLRRMLEWRIELDRHWSWRPGALGRGLKSRLDAATWAEVERTFTGAGIEANWQALWATTALFSSVAIEVGTALGYRYPDELDRGVTRYLGAIRALPR